MIRYQGKGCASNNYSISATNSYKSKPIDLLKQIFNLRNQKEVTESSYKVAKYGIIMLCKFEQKLLLIQEKF